MIHTNCKLIGLTGGIASGKSTVSSILVKKGYKVIDADKIAREVVEVNKPAYIEIINSFGNSILEEDGSINRKKLADLVFSDETLLKKLNDITHPYIYIRIKEDIDKYCKKNDVVFVDIPLLYETYSSLINYNIDFYEIWLIYVDESTQIKRLMMRNSIDINEAKKRIKTQIPMKDKVKQATRIIDNRGDISRLEKKIDIAIRELE